jgi:threonine synthase
MSASLADHLECSRCSRRMSAEAPAGVCACGAPLLVRYRLSPGAVAREAVARRPGGVWRYRELLPDAPPVTLGEGGTPLLAAPRLAERSGLRSVWIKEEGLNATGSFKARGLAVAVAAARRLGIGTLAMPSAGNAGSALAAYGAAAGIPVHVFLPRDTPPVFFREAARYGAAVHPVAGTIRDCAREMRPYVLEKGWFDVATLREPYRLEGKKTMGFEIAEQLDWKLPDWIFYPTGGGTGLIGMMKAFDEMESLGWIGPARPRMAAVQAAGCAPIVRAFERGEEKAEAWEDPRTSAWGLRVPAPLGDSLILQAIRRTAGLALSVTEQEIAAGAEEMARLEGVLACPEGGATWAALAKMAAAGRIRSEDQVVLFNTGTGLKYLDIGAGDQGA